MCFSFHFNNRVACKSSAWFLFEHHLVLSYHTKTMFCVVTWLLSIPICLGISMVVPSQDLCLIHWYWPFQHVQGWCVQVSISISFNFLNTWPYCRASQSQTFFVTVGLRINTFASIVHIVLWLFRWLKWTGWGVDVHKTGQELPKWMCKFVHFHHMSWIKTKSDCVRFIECTVHQSFSLQYLAT